MDCHSHKIHKIKCPLNTNDLTVTDWLLSHWATSNYCSLECIFCQIFFLHNGTQLEGEKCKFQKLQNKDHPNNIINSISSSKHGTWNNARPHEIKASLFYITYWLLNKSQDVTKAVFTSYRDAGIINIHSQVMCTYLM